MPELSSSAAEAALDRSERPGRVSLLLLLAGLLVGAAVGLSFVANEQAQPIILGLLALLAMAGVFCLFAFAIGAIQLTGQGTRNDVTKAVVDAAPDGMIAMEEGGRPIYANAAYLKLAGSDTFTNLRPVERVFVGSPEVSEAVYRLAQAAREGILAAAVVGALARGEEAGLLATHYHSLLLASLRRHLQLSLPFYANGGAGRWWHEQYAAAKAGYEQTTALLARLPEPRFALHGFDLVRRELAA